MLLQNSLNAGNHDEYMHTKYQDDKYLQCLQLFSIQR